MAYNVKKMLDTVKFVWLPNASYPPGLNFYVDLTFTDCFSFNAPYIYNSISNFFKTCLVLSFKNKKVKHFIFISKNLSYIFTFIYFIFEIACH